MGARNLVGIGLSYLKYHIEVSVRGVVFYQAFLLSPLQCTVMHHRNCKRLLEFEEIKISRQSCRGDCE
jgi:hypothetical protein